MTKPFVLVGLLAAGCGSGGGSTAIYAGTCLEPLFRCLGASARGTCSFDQTTSVATMTFPNGAKVTSGSGGTQDNRAFGPGGSLCFTVTKINDTTRSYSGQGVNATFIDDGSGATVEIRCPGNVVQRPNRAAYNPANEDLSQCVGGS